METYEFTITKLPEGSRGDFLLDVVLCYPDGRRYSDRDLYLTTTELRQLESAISTVL